MLSRAAPVRMCRQTKPMEVREPLTGTARGTPVFVMLVPPPVEIVVSRSSEEDMLV